MRSKTSESAPKVEDLARKLLDLYTAIVGLLELVKPGLHDGGSRSIR
jgi:hypothetical protein